jgi:hypothetical protein
MITSGFHFGNPRGLSPLVRLMEPVGKSRFFSNRGVTPSYFFKQKSTYLGVKI